MHDILQGMQDLHHEDGPQQTAARDAPCGNARKAMRLRFMSVGDLAKSKTKKRQAEHCECI